MKSIYIILMNTGTIVSKTIIKFTGYKYSHVVLSLDDSYTKLYSFGRRTVHNFLNAGLVTYGLGSDFFKVFNQTDCVIYEVNISDRKYARLVKILKKYERNARIYHYDIRGLLIRSIFIKPKARENYYVCSQFVASVLKEAKIWRPDKETVNIRAEDFTKMIGTKKIYEGKFCESR